MTTSSILTEELFPYIRAAARAAAGDPLGTSHLLVALFEKHPRAVIAAAAEAGLNPGHVRRVLEEWRDSGTRPMVPALLRISPALRALLLALPGAGERPLPEGLATAIFAGLGTDDTVATFAQLGLI